MATRASAPQFTKTLAEKRPAWRPYHRVQGLYMSLLGIWLLVLEPGLLKMYNAHHACWAGRSSQNLWLNNYTILYSTVRSTPPKHDKL